MDALRHAADLADPDMVVHLAAQAGVRYSIDHPQTYADSNLIAPSTSWNSRAASSCAI